MKEKILQTLKDLRAYALTKGIEAAFFYQEEDSHLMRFANSAISLNTNEHLINLEIDVYEGKRRASFMMITDLQKLDEMKKGVDTAAEMVKYAMPLTYQPSIPNFSESFADESGYDEGLSNLSGNERLDYFNEASKGLESEDIKLSGIFSSGTNVLAQISTRSEHTQYFKFTDAEVSVVLAHSKLKWEVTGEQSAQKKSELNPKKLHAELAFLLEQYKTKPAQQIPVGKYDIVFGAAAISELLLYMQYYGMDGGMMKRGYSFLSEEQIDKPIFSEKVNLTDDPSRLETFPYKRDFMGMPRKAFPVFEKGNFKSFAWQQDDADEFGVKPTAHNVPHASIVMAGGEKEVSSLEELVKMPREKDILYIPFLHYMNVVNPSAGLITASSRFGALLLKKDGSVVVPFNVRVTQSFQDIFGEKVQWLAKGLVADNTSQSYGSRNPTANVVPLFMQVNDLEISHSNSSY